jgi:hypothetical protein
MQKLTHGEIVNVRRLPLARRRTFAHPIAAALWRSLFGTGDGLRTLRILARSIESMISIRLRSSASGSTATQGSHARDEHRAPNRIEGGSRRAIDLLLPLSKRWKTSMSSRTVRPRAAQQ